MTKLRMINLADVEIDTRPLYCPACYRVTATGFCSDCGFDWPDGCTKQLKAANPHVYGTVADMERVLEGLSDRYIQSGKTDKHIASAYRTIHAAWIAAS